MEPVLNSDEMRQADNFTIEKLGLSGEILMENAGKSCAEVMIRNFSEVFIWLLLLVFGIFYSWKIAITLLVLFLLYRIGKVVFNVLPRSRGGVDALLYALHIQFSRIPLVYGQILGLVEIFMKSISRKRNS